MNHSPINMCRSIRFPPLTSRKKNESHQFSYMQIENMHRLLLSVDVTFFFVCLYVEVRASKS